jgi:hypothetical protein
VGSTPRNIGWRGCIVALALSWIAVQGIAQEISEPPTNLQIFRSLGARIAGLSLAEVRQGDSSTVQLTVLPRETGWVIEDAVVGALIRQNFKTVDVNGAYRAEFGILELRVGYENVRRDGLFGPRIVDRTVRVSLHSKLFDQRSGTVVFSRDMTEEHRDTVLVSGVERLESVALPATRGQLPPEGFFSTIAEPIVVLGTVAVAVILLFTVRS